MSASTATRRTGAEESAAYWMVRLTSDACTPEDRAAFEAWRRADPEHQAAYDRMSRGAAFVDRHLADPLLQELAETARRETCPAWLGRRLQGVAVAACAAVMVVGATALLLREAGAPAGSEAGVAAPDVIALQQYETEIGERSTVALGDGSVVTLNTDSRIEVDYSAEERRIRLARGQALFEVERDADRPFVVEAGDRRIVALGTAFDVRLDFEAGVQVTLLEGRVEIDEADPESADPASRPDVEPRAPVALSPGEQFVSEAAGGAAHVRPAVGEDVTSWRLGRLVFRERPLSEAVAEMNRYSPQKLALDDDPRLHAMTVSGVFDTGRASSFVTALEAMHPVEARRTGRRELTLVRRD